MGAIIMRKFYVGAVLAAGAASILLTSGCAKPVVEPVQAENTEKEDAIHVTPVKAITPTRDDIAAYFETTSRVEAQNRVEVLSKGAGICLEVNAEVGDVVEKGQELVRLERDELEAQIRQARIAVQQQKTAYEIAKRSFEEGIGASAERDNMKFAYEQALANLDVAELKIQNQTVHAPMGGIITHRLIQKGMVVSPGIPLFSIVDPESYMLPVSVPEKELARLTVGQMAEAQIDAFPDRIFETHVHRIDPSIDPLSGTVRVLLDFAKTDKPLLRDAAFARVKLVMEVRRNALLLPRDAILEEEGRQYVFVLDEVDTSTIDMERFIGLHDRSVYQASRVEVHTGLEQSDVVQVTEGVQDDIMVVTMGQHTLKQDAYVTLSDVEEEISYRATMTLDEALVAAKENRDALISSESSSTSELNLSL